MRDPMLAGDRRRADVAAFRARAPWAGPPVDPSALAVPAAGGRRGNRTDRPARWIRAREAAAARFESDVAFGSPGPLSHPTASLGPRSAWTGSAAGIVVLGGRGFCRRVEAEDPAFGEEWVPAPAGLVPIGAGLRLRASYLYAAATGVTATTLTAWSERLAATGTWDLGPFLPAALAEAGAMSPVQGLLPAVSPAAPTGSCNSAIRADLADLLALRRQPAALATITFGSASLVRRPGAGAGWDRAATMAVLHGAADPQGQMVALLEETTDVDGGQVLALSTPAAEGLRILEAWRQLDEEAPAAASVEVFRPDPVQPARVQVTVTAGVARLSGDGREWQRSVPEEEFPELFLAALGL